MAHYLEFDVRQQALQRQLDDYFARGSSKQKKPCPPPGGGIMERAKNALVLLQAEYLRGKSLDDVAKHWETSSGGWKWTWPKPPNLGNSPQ